MFHLLDDFERPAYSILKETMTYPQAHEATARLRQLPFVQDVIWYTCYQGGIYFHVMLDPHYPYIGLAQNAINSLHWALEVSDAAEQLVR
jgi:hypothetical protein